MADTPGHDVLDAADGELGRPRPSIEVQDECAVGGEPHRDLAGGRLVIPFLGALHGWTIRRRRTPREAIVVRFWLGQG